MTNMFKKSLVAIALVGASTSAMAAEVSVTPVNVASEWASTVTVATNPSVGAVTANPIEIKLGAAYTQNDLVTLTFTGSSLIATSLPNAIPMTGGAGGAGAGTAALGLISAQVNSAGNTVVTYRVTVVDGDTTGATGTIPAALFRSRVLSGDVTVSFSAETATGQPLDTGGTVLRSGTVVRFGSQLNAIAASPVTGLNATIDVAANRRQFDNFTPATGSSASATFVVAPSTYGTPATAFTPDPVYQVNVARVDYTLSGDFGWMFNANGSYSGIMTTSNCAVQGFNAALTQVSVRCVGNNAFDPLFTIPANSPRAIPTQSFGLDAIVSYDLATSETNTKSLSRSAGSWELNGSNVSVSYMPYSGSISQVINVTNRSAQGGDISVEAIAEDGQVYDLGVVGHAAPRSVTRIAGDIQSKLSQAVGVNLATVGQTQRFALRIVTNAPQDQVEVYSAYNVNGTGARLVVNDSNGGGLSK